MKTRGWILFVFALGLGWLVYGFLTMTDPSTGPHPEPNRSELVSPGAPEIGPAS